MVLGKNMLLLILPLFLIGSIFADQRWNREQRNSLQVIGWEDHLLLRGPGGHDFFLWGDRNREVDMVTKSLSSFGSSLPEVVKVEVVLPRKALRKENVEINFISTGVWRGVFGEEVFLFFEKGSSVLFSDLPPISLQSDWWVLEQSSFSDQLPLPEKGILFVANHKPGKSLLAFAKERKIPLVSIYDVGMFWMTVGDGVVLRVGEEL